MPTFRLETAGWDTHYCLNGQVHITTVRSDRRYWWDHDGSALKVFRLELCDGSCECPRTTVDLGPLFDGLASRFLTGKKQSALALVRYYANGGASVLDEEI